MSLKFIAIEDDIVSVDNISSICLEDNKIAFYLKRPTLNLDDSQIVLYYKEFSCPGEARFKLGLFKKELHDIIYDLNKFDSIEYIAPTSDNVKEKDSSEESDDDSDEPGSE